VHRIARDLWRVIEPYHQLAYRSPEATAAYEALGLDRPDLQYFGNRLAAMGPIGAKMAVAVLYGFAPTYVGGAVPEVWNRAAAHDVAVARRDAAGAVLHRVLADGVASHHMTRAGDLARRVFDSVDFAGRPMAAAQAEAPWSDEPALVLWQVCTVLREHRGDAHWAATSGEGVGPVECHVLHAADGAMPAELLQRVSGWNDDAWAGAVESLRGRDLLDGDGALTDAGRTVKWRIEWATDAAALQPLRALGDDGVAELRQLMAPWVRSIVEADVVGAWKLREELWRDLPDAPETA
jgi:hypothetical protein